MRSHFAFLDHPSPILYAHRGGNAAGSEKENSMAAFEASYRLGYEYFETDVVSAATGEVLAIHGSSNERVARKTDMPARAILEHMSYEEIRRKVKIGNEQVPLLEEVLTTFPEVRVNIDAKTQAVVEPLGKLLTRLKAVDRVCLASFRYERTKQVAEALGGQDKVCTSFGPLGFVALLASERAHLPLGRYLRQSKAACLQVPLTVNDMRQASHVPDQRFLITGQTVEKAEELGLPVHVWTVNNVVAIRQALAMGVSGIMSDEVKLLKAEAQTYGV